MTIPACLQAFNDHELAQWLRGLDASVAEGRRREHETLTAWYAALRDSAELEQRRRRGEDADDTLILQSLYRAAVALPEDRRQRLMTSYDDLFMGRSTVPPKHPLAMLGGILHIILDAASAPPTVA